MRGVRYIGEHVEGCYAAKAVALGRWTTPWWFPRNASPIWRDLLGRRGAKTWRWHVLECNCTYCPAQKLVREDLLCQVGETEAPQAP